MSIKMKLSQKKLKKYEINICRYCNLIAKNIVIVQIKNKIFYQKIKKHHNINTTLEIN